MALDKFQARIEAKIDALLEKAGVKLEEIKVARETPAESELTTAEQEAMANARQEAINNAPPTPVASPPQEVPGAAAPAPAPTATDPTATDARSAARK